MNMIRTVSAVFLAGTMLAGPIVLPEMAQAREKRETLAEAFGKKSKQLSKVKTIQSQRAVTKKKSFWSKLKQRRKSFAETLHLDRAEKARKRRQKALAAKRLKKQQAAARQELANKPVTSQPRVLPKVKTSRNYNYVVAKRSAISITPKKLVFAAALQATNADDAVLNDGVQGVVEKPVATLMTRDLHLTGKGNWRAEKHLAAALSEYYSKTQSYHWLNAQGEWNARARSVKKVLAKANSFGLNAADYTFGSNALDANADEKARAADRLSREMSMSVAVLRYAMDAKHGRINPNRLSGYHDFPKTEAETSKVLAEVFGPGLPANTLVGLHPDNAKFRALRNELTEMTAAENDTIDLPTKVIIKPGRVHDNLPEFVMAIKKRGSEELLEAHEEVFAEYSGTLSYTPELVALVKAYQKEAGLGPDGIIGPNTARKLIGETFQSKTDRVIYAMERLRWLPHEFGARHVFINQPEYRARYVVNGEEELSMRVVVGKKSNQTNFFYDEIEHVEFNPYWNVPRSIVVNEFLPKSLSNPGYLDSKGYELASYGSGKKISSRQVSWSQVGTTPKFSVRQPPGPSNALGQLKIMFPNDHAIYMHDTPAKALFNRDTRAFSHGCVRLHDPQAMAAAVLGKSKSQVAASISGGKNHTERLQQKVPVYVSYFTAWPQQDGTVKYFTDMYGRDAHLKKAIDKTTKARSQPLNS